MATKKKGLLNKYYLQKITSRGLQPVPETAEYFILRLDEGQRDRDHLHACRKAIQMYAACISASNPELSKDLREKYS